MSAWWRAFLIAMGIYLLTRVVVIGWAYATPQDRSQANVEWWSSNPLVRWDAGHYASIAHSGYPLQICDTTAFFPAYPLAVRFLQLA